MTEIVHTPPNHRLYCTGLGIATTVTGEIVEGRRESGKAGKVKLDS